jgi:integrase
MNLTAKTVTALQMPAGKTDHIEWDGTLPGFGYRLRSGAGGKVLRSWVAQYRHAGRTRRLLLGSAEVLSPDKARDMAKKALAAVALGTDPQAERSERRAKDRNSFRVVVDEHLKDKESSVRRRTFIELKRYLTGKYFKPLHSMPIDTITRRDLSARLVAITRDSGSITAARARGIVNGLFIWAMTMGLADANPVVGAVKPKDSEGRSRVLTDAELASVWRACEEDEHGRILRLLALTGCRRQEVGGMRWSELDAERGAWTMPPSRTKNKREHALPLPSAAWDIISTVPRMANRDHLFGLRAESGFVCWGAAKADLDAKLGDSVAPWTLHDLRRTVATRMADLGVQPHAIEEILNHRSGHKAGIAGIYNRSSYEREVKAALLIWADHVRALAEGGDRKIISFTPAS